MRDRRLFHGNGSLHVADADTTRVPAEDIQDLKPHGMREQGKVVAQGSGLPCTEARARPRIAAPFAACPRNGRQRDRASGR